MSHFAFQDVWAVVRRIPEGKVTTYGQIARILGHPRAARLVGFALHTAPDSVPCHRVVSSEGRLSGAFQPFGKATHRMLLEMENVPFTSSGNVDCSKCLWNPDLSGEV